MNQQVLLRFLNKINITEQCWLWTGATSKNGYGQFWYAHQIGAHRFSYTWFVGPIADGLQLDHICRVRNCVNPDHLEVVTASTNVLRGPNHNREKTHCKHGHCFDQANTIVLSRGERRCRQCHSLRQRRYNARNTH